MYRNLIYDEGGTTDQRNRMDYLIDGIRDPGSHLEKNKTGSPATTTYKGEIQVD